MDFFIYGLEQEKIGIYEKTGGFANLATEFIDEEGQKIILKDLIDKPTILVLVYYKCSGICNPLLGAVSEVINNLDLDPSKDYKIITISFDETDTYKIAAVKKRNYLVHLRNRFPEKSWRFLTGDIKNIKGLTDSVGFYFKREGKELIHPTGLIILSKEGKITRYLFGISFLPFDLKMALLEAAEGKVGSPVNRILRFCYSYEPKGRKYVFNFLRVFGIGTIIMVGFLLIFLISKKREDKK